MSELYIEPFEVAGTPGAHAIVTPLGSRMIYPSRELAEASLKLMEETNEVRVTDPDTGGMKGKKPERYGLIPVEALAEVARVYGYGAEKYDDNNWRRGYNWSLSYDALQRHINAFWSGDAIDNESGLHHLAHAVFHLFTLMTYDGVTEDRINPVYHERDDRAF